METGLKDRVAIVAAASQGIGRAVAEGLAAEGARLALCSRNREKIEQAAREIHGRYGVEVFPVAMDVSREDAIKSFVEAVAGRWGRIDVCVTNTGGPPSKPFAALTEEEWHHAFESIVMSVVRFARETIPHMQRQHWGRFIMLTSVSVKQPIPNLVLSNTLRAGLMGLVKTLASEYGRDGVLVNNVAPGYTATGRQEELAIARAKAANSTPEEMKKRWGADTALGRIAEPREIADAVVWLASERASNVTGHTLLVEGGSYRGL